MANPTFNPNAPFTVEGAAPAPTFDPNKPFEVAKQGPTVSQGEAFVHGVASGMSAGFVDELEGVRQAAGTVLPKDTGRLLEMTPFVGPLVKPVAGGLALLRDRLFGGEDATKAYQAGRDRVRELQKAAQAQYPKTYIAGEVTGALATVPVMPQANLARATTVAGRAANAAVTGAAYGGLSGAGQGEGAEDTLKKTALGTAVGGVGGAVASPVVDLAARGVSRVLRPFQAAANPEDEAARRAFTALAADDPALTPAAASSATRFLQQTGEPVVLADLGGEATRALARSSANTSPAGREALQRATGPRFQDEGARIADDVRWIVGGDPEAVGAREAIHAAAERANRANYAATYRDPRGQALWDEGFEQLTTAPDVKEAIAAATKTGLNKAAADGFRPPRNPFDIAPDGTLTLKVGPNGETIKPTIQFWDHVKRNLDDKVNALLKAGEKSAAEDTKALRRYLVQHLDDLVPTYKRARSQAAEAFGAEDALTAGEKFVTQKMENEEARRALAKMTPEQRQAFGYGFASELIKMIREVPQKDRSTVASKAFLNSPAAKERIEMSLGPDGLRRLEARVRLENIMDQTRAAVAGNSTTARQLVEAGLAGGFQGAGLGVGFQALSGDMDPSTLGTAAVLGAMLRATGRGIDVRVSRRVGELLSSNDPQRIQQAAQMAARNPRLLDALRRTDAYVTRVLSGESAEAGQKLLGAAASRADEEQERGKGRVEGAK